MATMTDLLTEMERAEQPRRQYRAFSFWEVECACGRLLQLTLPQGACPGCHRVIEIGWGRPAQSPARAA